MATSGLDPFMIEIRFQGSAAKRAFVRLEELLAERRALGIELRRIREAGGPLPLQAELADYGEKAKRMANMIPWILESLQSYLVAAGILASILFPDERTRPGVTPDRIRVRVTRGAELRRILSAGAESPLAALQVRATDARGGLVHYDEMIEDFLGVGDELVTIQIGSFSTGAPLVRTDTVRRLDEDTLVLNVNGRETPLRALLDEIRRIASQIQVNGTETLVQGGHYPGYEGLAVGIVASGTAHSAELGQRRRFLEVNRVALMESISGPRSFPIPG
jgi:hypothetical protein